MTFIIKKSQLFKRFNLAEMFAFTKKDVHFDYKHGA